MFFIVCCLYVWYFGSNFMCEVRKPKQRKKKVVKKKIKKIFAKS